MLPGAARCRLSPGLGGFPSTTFPQRSTGEGAREPDPHLCLPFPLAGGSPRLLPGRGTPAVAPAMPSICADSWGAGWPPALGAFLRQLLAPAQTQEFMQLRFHSFIYYFFFPLHLAKCRAREACLLLRLAQPPALCGGQRLWLEHAAHVLGFERRSLRLCNVPTSLPRGHGGTGGPPSPREHQGV